MERYYKEWCDMKIPALSNKTPREAITTEEGKKLVKELLLDMENNELHKKKRGELRIHGLSSQRGELSHKRQRIHPR